ncbi:MAG: hypothetical protein JW910_23525, partial [Anaerolineae bacterium]|nr:hypothetical protein [Anaerolineae bacterium]
WFLALLVAQDANTLPPAEGLLVLGDGMRGVAQGNKQVMFDLTPGDDQDVTQAAFQIAPGVDYTLVTGLRPGTVYLLQTEGNFTQTLDANQAGILVIAGVPSGRVTLTVQP